MKELGLVLPSWASGLSEDHAVKAAIYESLLSAARNVDCLRSIYPMAASLVACPYISGARVESIDLGRGTAVAALDIPQEVYYGIIDEEAGLEIHRGE